jgi:predicted transcriptional regulator
MRSQYDIIRDLMMAADGSTMTDMCKMAHINQTQFKDLMPPLVKKGFVSMEKDGRATYMLTIKGRDLITRFDGLLKEIQP